MGMISTFSALFSKAMKWTMNKIFLFPQLDNGLISFLNIRAHVLCLLKKKKKA